MLKKSYSLKSVILLATILICLCLALFIKELGVFLPIIVIALTGYIAVQIAVIKNPKIGVWLMVFYCFTFIVLDREIGGIPYGTLQEAILLLGWLTVLFKSKDYDWKLLKNDLVYLLSFWFILSFLEVVNPAGASPMGWMQEIRAAAVYPFLVVPLSIILFRSNKDMNTFIFMILGLSLVASFNGLRQLYIGLTPGEKIFLAENPTHMIWGKLRVFSIYSDAGQFGASQAHLGLVALILAFGPYKLWKRLLLGVAALFMIYGMMISGTRGALFALVIGGFLAILLSKKFKVVIVGGIVMCAFLGFLKFTTIGNNNYQILRLRSAVDSKDPSLNVRLTSQKILRDYLSTRPLGGGLGVIGVWGEIYNKDKFLASIQPDSYWVKVWAMYGIVGFVIWFGIMMYILGKCCGIAWQLEDKGLQVKVIALTAGYAGILFCSYANEVINTAPSSYVVYISWVFIYLSPKLDKELAKRKQQPATPEANAELEETTKLPRIAI